MGQKVTKGGGGGGKLPPFAPPQMQPCLCVLLVPVQSFFHRDIAKALEKH